ncbi:MAG: ATP-dependent helicase HrpB, partial [Actinobacteria bacterium]|nr:ATP-dependent helicase HrpB [Actinomycetota bacterium]
ERIRDRGLGVLPWTAKARQLRTRVAYLREGLGDQWPDWSDETLRGTLDTWLAPYLREPRGLDDVRGIDLVTILRSQVPYPQSVDIDRLAPTHITVPSGRSRPVGYSGETPTLTVRVQDMYGSTETPVVGGRPLVLNLVSPANRTVQITSDLAGFWADSYEEVRKEMAGRYPKHSWPKDPATARPEVRG